MSSARDRAPRAVDGRWARWLAPLRVRQWLHFLMLPLAGASAATTPFRLALGFVVTALALAYAYALNAISDRHTDLDPRKNPLVGGECPARLHALVAALLVTTLIAALTQGPLAAGAAALSLLAGTLYSVGPRLKRLPLVGTLVNVFIFAPLMLTTLEAHAPPAFALEAALFVLLLVQNQLLHERADADEDARAGVRTTATVLLPRQLTVVQLLLAATAASASMLLAPSAITRASALVAVFAAAVVVTRGGSWRRRRVLHRWTAFAGGAFLFVTAVWT